MEFIFYLADYLISSILFIEKIPFPMRLQSYLNLILKSCVFTSMSDVFIVLLMSVNSSTNTISKHKVFHSCRILSQDKSNKSLDLATAMRL